MHKLGSTLAALVVFAAGGAAAEDLPSLGSPVRCEMGVQCFVQNFVDHDPGPDARDFQCGKRTYNVHNGTDFRVASNAVRRLGVEVLAVADGVIARTRDGVEDISVRVGGFEAVKDKECGNGVVVEHANGWSTQYCHMAKGSIRVRPGERIAAGQPIGLIGLSGNTEFPHVHLSVRKNTQIVDPYAYSAPAGSCGGGTSLWDPKIAEAVAYKTGEVMNVGFAGATVTMESIESDDVSKTPLQNRSPLLAYARSIGLKARDEQALRIEGPDATVIAEYKAPPLEADRAQQFISAGKKAPPTPWPAGRYTATYTVSRSGSIVLTKTFSAEMPPE